MIRKRVLGLDWIDKSHGWAFASLRDEDNTLVATIGCLAIGGEASAIVRNADCIVLDAPIGLPDEAEEGCKHRPCDSGARTWVGTEQRSSIFAVPYQGELEEWRRRDQLGERQKLGHFRGLLPAIHSASLIQQNNKRVLESHPELCFAALLGKKLPSAASKKTLIGALVRLAILKQRRVSISLEQLQNQGRIPSDNFVDAISMALIAFGWQINGNLSIICESNGNPCDWIARNMPLNNLIALPPEFRDSRNAALLTPVEIITLARNGSLI